MRKRVAVISMIILLLASLTACFDEEWARKDGVVRLYFVSATGDKTHPYCFDFNEEPASSYGMDLSSVPRKNLKGDVAKELIKEILAIPQKGFEEGDLAFIIRLSYQENGVTYHIRRIGYGRFPDNWDRIVTLLNEMFDGKAEYEITHSQDIVHIDAEYMKKNYGLEQSMLPDTLSVDDFIKNAPLDYETLFSPRQTFVLEKAIYTYLTDYFGIGTHKRRILDTDPPASTEKELQEFAESRLDEISSTSSASVSGTHNNVEFTIYKYDGFMSYIDSRENESVPLNKDNVLIWKGPDDSGKIVEKSLYIDGSGKFVIATDSSDLITVNDVIQ